MDNAIAEASALLARFLLYGWVMRVYIPVTSTELFALSQRPDGAYWDIPAGVVHGVTPQLKSEFPDADEEELEWEASNAAADDSLALVLGNAEVSPVRAILSVDVPDKSISAPLNSGLAPSSLNMTAVPDTKIAAVHVDEPEVAEIIKSWRAAGAPTPAQRREVDDAHLLWYDGSELDQLKSDVLT